MLTDNNTQNQWDDALRSAEEALTRAISGATPALSAELALAQRNLQDAVLKAPADGIIQSRILEPGDMASPQQPIYTLALQQPLWARVYVGESDLGRVKPGMPAQVESDSQASP